MLIAMAQPKQQIRIILSDGQMMGFEFRDEYYLCARMYVNFFRQWLTPRNTTIPFSERRVHKFRWVSKTRRAAVAGNAQKLVGCRRHS